MPAVIPAIIVGWSAIGAATIGSIAIGGILQGAIIGAAIGGLTSAVTGGSIGKGMLFGAIGGAVTGGLTSYMSGMGGAGWTSQPLGWGGDTVASQVTSASTRTLGNSLSGIGGNAAASSLSANGAKIAGKVSGSLVEGGLDLVGGMMAGADESKDAAKQREWQAEQNAMDRKMNEKLAAMRTDAAGNDGEGERIARIQQETAYAQLGENRRQYNVARSDVETKRKRAGAALSGVRAGVEAEGNTALQSMEAQMQPQVSGEQAAAKASAAPQGGMMTIQEMPNTA